MRSAPKSLHKSMSTKANALMAAAGMAITLGAGSAITSTSSSTALADLGSYSTFLACRTDGTLLMDNGHLAPYNNFSCLEGPAGWTLYAQT